MGVGTTRPQNKLDVFGSANVSGALGVGSVFVPTHYLDVRAPSVNAQFVSTTGTNNAYGKFVNGSNSLLLGVDSSAGGTLGTNVLPYAGVINSTSYPLQLAPGNTVAMTLLTSGNVGIGTTTPWGKLSVTNTGTGPSFIVEDSASPDASPFVVDASGNVGVGTSSPISNLSIFGGTSSVNIGGNYGSGYNGIWLNGGNGLTNFNFLSSALDTNLYINRPTGKDIFFEENG